MADRAQAEEDRRIAETSLRVMQLVLAESVMHLERQQWQLRHAEPRGWC